MYIYIYVLYIIKENSIIQIPAQGLRKVYVKNSGAQGLRKVAQGISRCAQGKTCSRERARPRKVFFGARKEKPVQGSAQGRARWRKEPAQGVEGICLIIYSNNLAA